MDVAHPYAAICPTLESQVLAVLAGTTRPLTGREIARLAGRSSHSGVRGALSRLVESGLVDRREAGRAFLFELNREHLAAPAVEILAEMRTELFARLRREIDSWAIAPVHVSVFGSTARGDGDARSDIDLFVVRPADVDEEDEGWRAQLDRIARQIERWTGNRAGLAEACEGEIARLRIDTPPIVAELRSDSITLAGPDTATLLGTT